MQVFHNHLGRVERPRFALISLAVTAFVVFASLPLPARADSWLGYRGCHPSQRCESVSQTSGTPGQYQYTVHEHNGTRSTEWPLTASPTTRRFRHGTGSVEIFIYTTGNLHSQSATCVCVSPPCPNF